jgi:DNA-binding LytR/AlgR family response regulator
MINCIALDDEPIALEIIKVYCEKTPSLNLVKVFTQASKAKKYLRKYPVDLLFLDIQMPDVNGVDFYKSIVRKPLVIFTTAHLKYAVEAFEVSAIDYLIKPINLERFTEACTKALNTLNTKRNHHSHEGVLYIRSNYSLIKILFDNIIYIETQGDYILIHQEDSEPIQTLMSLSLIEDKLPDNDFIRVHRSYIVAFKKIKSIRRYIISIGTKQIPVGSTYKVKFDEYFS